MTTLTESTAATQLWELVALNEYRLPESPVAQAAGSGLALYKRWFKSRQSAPSASLIKPSELNALTDQQLEQIAPESDFEPAIAAINRALHDWLAEENPTEAVIVILAPPHSAYAEIFKLWAQQRAWRLLQAPNIEQISTHDPAWLNALTSSSSPWVLTHLEQCFLRHASGMHLLRSFLNAATSGTLGKGIIVCDSWAWAFIQHIWPGRLPVMLTFQAFDQQRLTQLFTRAIHSNTKNQYIVRQSVDGEDIIPAEQTGEDLKISPLLQHLAMYARGNAGIANGIWRANLEAEINPPGTEVVKQKTETLWILPWQQLHHPDVEAYVKRDEIFILHALLIHNGLTSEQLARVILLAESQLLAKLFYLQAANLVAEQSGHWLVTAQAYPAIRELLLTSDYLVDQL